MKTGMVDVMVVVVALVLEGVRMFVPFVMESDVDHRVQSAPKYAFEDTSPIQESDYYWMSDVSISSTDRWSPRLGENRTARHEVITKWNEHQPPYVKGEHKRSKKSESLQCADGMQELISCGHGRQGSELEEPLLCLWPQLFSATRLRMSKHPTITGGNTSCTEWP